MYDGLPSAGVATALTVRELRSPVVPRWRPLLRGVGLSMLLAFAFYLTVGLAGYLTFGDAAVLHGNLLNAYPRNGLVSTARLGIALVVLTSFPLQAYAFRTSLPTFVHALATFGSGCPRLRRAVACLPCVRLASTRLLQAHAIGRAEDGADESSGVRLEQTLVPDGGLLPCAGELAAGSNGEASAGNAASDGAAASRGLAASGTNGHAPHVIAPAAKFDSPSPPTFKALKAVEDCLSGWGARGGSGGGELASLLALDAASFLSAMLMLLGTTVVALAVSDLGAAIALGGAILGNTLTFTIPGLVYALLARRRVASAAPDASGAEEGGGATAHAQELPSASRQDSSNDALRRVAIGMVVLGFALVPVTAASSFVTVPETHGRPS